MGYVFESVHEQKTPLMAPGSSLSQCVSRVRLFECGRGMTICFRDVEGKTYSAEQTFCWMNEFELVAVGIAPSRLWMPLASRIIGMCAMVGIDSVNVIRALSHLLGPCKCSKLPRMVLGLELINRSR